MASAANGHDLERRYDIQIPALKADAALKSLARQAEAQLLFSYDVAKTVQANPVSGRYTLSEALELILQGTGLSSSLTKSGVITVTPTPTAARQDTEQDMNSKKRLSMLGTIAAFLGAGIGSHPVRAEEPTAGLEEIVVTALRREETIDKVPISITALTQQTMDDLHIQKLADLATLVPGLYINTPGAADQEYSNVAIRGIGSATNSPTTQFYVDETPIAIRQFENAANSGSPQPLIFDLDRVEVLRGPQGTLFGASAMGGAIRFITPQPNLTQASGFAKADVGYTDHGGMGYEVGAAYGAPMVAGVAGFRVSAWYQTSGGFVDQGDPVTGRILKRNVNSTDSYVIRQAFTWAPVDGLTITPSLFMQQIHSEFSGAYWLNHIPNPESNGHVWGGISQPSTDNLRVASLAIKYNVGGLVFQSDTSYLDREITALTDTSQILQYFTAGTDFIPGAESFHAQSPTTTFTHAWQQEFRLSSQDPSARVRWVAGVFYRRAVQGIEQLYPPDLTPLTELVYGKTSLQYFGNPNYIYSGQALNAYANVRATDISEAVFGDIAADLTSHLKAEVGVRIEHQIVDGQSQIFAGPIDGLTYSSIVLPDQKATPVTPRASLTYQYADDDMVYMSAAKGFRPGGGNSVSSIGNSLCEPSLKALGLSSIPTSFNSDSLWSYEIGAKDVMFDRRLAFEGSVYYIRWSDIQTGVSLPSCGQAFTGNRGLAISKGVDLQVAAVLAGGLKARVLFGYDDAYRPNTEYGAPGSNGIPPVLGYAGDKLGGRPWTFAANADYSRDIGALWADARSYLRVDYRRLSAIPAGNPKDPGFDPIADARRDAPYAILNLRLGVTRGGLDLSAYVNNATNSNPFLGFFAVTGEQIFRGAALQPRTAGITAWYRF